MITRPLIIVSCALFALACNRDGEPAEATSDPSTSGDATSGEDTAAPLPTCGDGHIDPGEVCDGDDLDGLQCADIDPAFTGALACAADCRSVEASACTLQLGALGIVFNEVTAKSPTDGPYAGRGDAIEIVNRGQDTVDLSGWKLSDEPALPVDKTFLFPPGSALAPGGRLVLVEIDPDTGEGDLPFGISSSADDNLTLVDADDVPADQLLVAGPDALVSWCRLPDGTGDWQRCDQTLGAVNSADGAICGDGQIEGGELCDAGDMGGTACADLGFTGGALLCAATCTLDASGCLSDSPIVLNELEAVDDRIEIYNSGDQLIDLTGWILTDDVIGPAYDPALDPEKLVIPNATTLGPDSYLVIGPGKHTLQHPFGLSGSGDTVTLLAPDLTRISQVTYGAAQADISYCRLPTGWSAGCLPTLGAANKMP